MRGEALKRLVDLSLALALVPVALPVCTILMIAIRIETPGPSIFVQTRLGRGMKPFRMLKLRTMLAGTDDLPSHLVGSNRISRVGAFLRRTKLDELPQLANVISGSMSFVGPRPCLPTQHELISERARRGLFAHRPGITGPAQLGGLDMSEPTLLAETEARYFSTATVLSDIGMVLRTALGKGQGDAALVSRLRGETGA